MNELRRSVYLQALGIESYVSRGQLAGASVTRRLAVGARPAAQPTEEPVSESASPRRRQQAPPVEMPRVEAAAAPVAARVEPGPVRKPEPLRFSLAAVTCGGWLWLEELDQAPFTPRQLQLVQSMSEALARLAGGSETHDRPTADTAARLTQFDWPMHTNLQLDQGEDAARSSVAAFIQRKLEQGECTGLILMGQECAARLPLEQLDCARLARTVSTARMLREPLLKRQAWQDLASFCRPA